MSQQSIKKRPIQENVHEIQKKSNITHTLLHFSDFNLGKIVHALYYNEILNWSFALVF